MKTIDLFCGAGGLSKGFEQAGHDVAWGVDFDETRVQTWDENHDGEAIQADLASPSPQAFYDEHEIDTDEINCVIGGPPCQGFSVAGEQADDDERNNFVFVFADHVAHVLPQAFVMENVKGLLSAEDGAVVDRLVSDFESSGYSVEHRVMDAHEYGVPQKRQRVIFKGVKNGDVSWPDRTTVGNPPSVADAIDDLPDLTAGEESGVNAHNAINHRDETVAKLRETPHGQAAHPAYARAEPDEPAYTIVAGKASPPVHHSQPRRCTVRETARIQTFPDSFTFPDNSSRKERYQMVGNAVPVELARRVAKSVQ